MATAYVKNSLISKVKKKVKGNAATSKNMYLSRILTIASNYDNITEDDIVEVKKLQFDKYTRFMFASDSNVNNAIQSAAERLKAVPSEICNAAIVSHFRLLDEQAS